MSDRVSRAILAWIGLDTHTVGRIPVIRVFKESGIETIDLNVKNSIEDIVSAVLQEDVDVICLGDKASAAKEFVPIMVEQLRSAYREQGFSVEEIPKIIVGGTINPRYVDWLTSYGVVRFEDDLNTPEKIAGLKDFLPLFSKDGRHSQEESFNPNHKPLQEMLSSSIATARLLSLTENNVISRKLQEEIDQLSRPYIVGVTGDAGSGKSTLIYQLVKYAAQQESIGVVAVDTSSQKLGGALLGDRVRMKQLTRKCFVRSQSIRTNYGGIAVSTQRMSRILGGAGYGAVIVETIGAGQQDFAIEGIADTVIHVIPSSIKADTITTLKSGIMEMNAVYVINYSSWRNDREHAQQVAITLRQVKGASTMIFMDDVLVGTKIPKLWNRVRGVA